MFMAREDCMKGWRVVVLSVLMFASVGVVSCACWVEIAAIAQPSETLTQNQIQITFEGTVPPWANTATAVMAELEQWRGLPFTENLQVTFQAQAP